MSNAVSLPTEMAERLRENIRKQMMDMIPAEKLDQLIANEMKAFFEVESENVYMVFPSNYGNRPEAKKVKMPVTPFRAFVWTQMTEYAGKHIIDRMASPEFIKEHLDPNLPDGATIDDAYRTFAEKQLQALAPIMAQALFQQSIAGMLKQSKLDMQNSVQQAFAAAGMPYIDFNC